jgi:1-acyl-sn-glycerol-3-phosphate acyltransferase
MLSFKSNFAASFPELPQLTQAYSHTTKVTTVHSPQEPSCLSPVSTPVGSVMTEHLAMRAEVSPWLSSWVYPLSHYGFLPRYFRSLQVVGQTHLPKSGPVILAPTHRSRWDALIVPYAAGKHMTGRHLRYMVTIDEMRGLQGWFIRHMGGFAIDTRAPGISSLRYGIDLLHQNQTVVIFPEGGDLLANRAKGLNQLHPGLARLALQAMHHPQSLPVQIVPMAINYTGLEKGRCDVEVQIGQAIDASKYLGNSNKRSAQQITQDLSYALKQLSHL